MTAKGTAIARAAGWGAIAGAPLLLVKTWATGDTIPVESSALAGFLMGGMILGALLFGLVAAVACSMRG